MAYLKIFGLMGIVLELIGAAYMVYAANKSRKSLKEIDPQTFAGVGIMAEKTHGIISGQTRSEIIGFTFLGIGLLMQFGSGFFSR